MVSNRAQSMTDLPSGRSAAGYAHNWIEAPTHLDRMYSPLQYRRPTGGAGDAPSTHRIEFRPVVRHGANSPLVDLMARRAVLESPAPNATLNDTARPTAWPPAIRPQPIAPGAL
jgi:hypothetical protein